MYTPKNRFGWKPETADHRDREFKPMFLRTPKSVPILTSSLPIEDQGWMGSCVGHAVTSAFEYLTGVTDRSRLFTYYQARLMEGFPHEDTGCYIRDAIKSVKTQGICSEKLWPYEVKRLFRAPGIRPTKNALTVIDKIAEYQRLRTIVDVKNAISQGLPVIFGFAVTPQFDSIAATTGTLPLPTTSDTIIGGHAVLGVGFDETDPNFPYIWVRNSYGPRWGIHGHFRMPYGWFTDPRGMVDDIWTMIPTKRITPIPAQS